MSLLQAALARIPVDLLLTNVRLANVLTGEIYPADIAVWNGRIAAVEPPGSLPARSAQRVIDGQGRIATPGLVDAHLHIESSLVTPAAFAEAVLPLGVTTVLEDPHEVANVLGADGIRAMLAASDALPLKVEYLVSSSVPSAVGLETAGGSIEADDVTALLAHPRVHGLAEVMDGAGIMAEDPRLLAILAAAGGLEGYRPDSPGVIEGHNPMLRGRALSAWVAIGVDSDHTLATAADLVEKARQGVTLMLQERYMTTEVIAALESLPLDIGLCLITDDVAPDYLLEVGHLDHLLRLAVRLGMDPMRALRTVTLNPARRMRLWDRGAIAPGRAADIVLVDSLADFQARLVLVDGQVVAEEGRCLWRAETPDPLASLRGTLRVRRQTPDDFRLPTPIHDGELEARVMECVHQTVAVEGQGVVLARAGIATLPEGSDLIWLAIVNRYDGLGGRAFGLVRGLGVQCGAFASSHAHDSHNLAVFGKTAEDMALAANTVIDMDGGIAVVRDGVVLARLPLPIAGILSDRSVAATAEDVRAVYAALNDLGLFHPYWLMRISTFTLPVSSGLRITDRGLVLAKERRLVSLWRDQG